MRKKKVPLSGELLGLFLAEYQHSPETQRGYETDLVALLNAIGWQRDIRKIQPEELTAYMKQLRERRSKYTDHPTRPTVKSKLSESTLNGHVKSIRRWFNWMVNEGYLDLSPARKLKQTKLPHWISRDKAMKDGEYELILDYAQRHSPRDYALILLIADSGIRAKEAATLTLDYIYPETLLAFVVGKNQQSRYVPFGEECLTALIAWLKVRPKVSHSYVFTSALKPYEPISSNAVSQIIRRACQHLKLQDLDVRSLGSHAARHRKGHQFADNGVPITTAMTIMGWMNIKSAQGYYQQTFEEAMRTGRRLTTPRRSEKEGL